MEMSKKVQLTNGMHREFASNERKTSLASLIHEAVPRAAHTHNQAVEPRNRVPGVIAKLMGLDKLPPDVKSPQNSTECIVDRMGICSSTPKATRDRQHHEDRLHKCFQKMEKVSLYQSSVSEDEKTQLCFQGSPKVQQVGEFQRTSIPPSYSKLQEAEFRESEELIDAIKYLQSNKETFTRFLQDTTKLSSFDKHIEKNSINSCLSSEEIDYIDDEWNTNQTLHFKPRTTDRSHMKKQSNISKHERGRDAFERLRVPMFGVQDEYSIDTWKDKQNSINFTNNSGDEYRMDAEFLQSAVDFKFSSRAEYSMNSEKNLDDIHNNMPSRIVILKPSRSRKRNQSPILVEFQDNYKEVRKRDKNIDHNSDGKLLDNSTREFYKYDGTMPYHTGNYIKSLKSPRKISKETRHVKENCTRGFMATHKDMHLNYMDLDLDLPKPVSKVKKKLSTKINKHVINGADLGFEDTKAKKQFKITILRPTELVRECPNSGWGKAMKKFENTLFEVDGPVTSDITSQSNIDFYSFGIDISSIDSYITSQNHDVCGSKYSANSQSWSTTTNDESKKSINIDNEKDPSKCSPVSVLNEPFLEEEYIEIQGNCLVPECDLSSQLHQEDAAFQRNQFEHSVADHTDSLIDAKPLDHMESSEMVYIKDVLLASGLMSDNDIFHHIHSLSQPLNPSLFRTIDLRYLSKQSRWGTLNSPAQRQLLFDALNEILCDFLGFPLHCCGKMFASQHMLPSRERLIKHVLSIVACPFQPMESLFTKHVIRDRWLDPNIGMEALGDHMECCILDDLIEETTTLLFPSKHNCGLYTPSPNFHND